MIGAYKPIYQLLDPVLQFLRAIPPTAIIPVGILLIGIGDQMKIVVIAFGAMWPILHQFGRRRAPGAVRTARDGARSSASRQFETLIAGDSPVGRRR